jgi:hypothetical protein
MGGLPRSMDSHQQQQGPAEPVVAEHARCTTWSRTGSPAQCRCICGDGDACITCG